MIAAFIANRMIAYLAGGMTPANAATLTMGELGAVYRGNHYSRDLSGALRITAPPEALDIEAAKKKAGAALSEFMKAIKGSRAEQAPENSALMGTIKNPEQTSWADKKNGLEGLKNYARGNTA